MAAAVNERPIPTGEGLTFEKVWALFQEVAERQIEADRRIQETERLMRENTAETERLMKESSAETDRQIKRTEKLVAKLSKNMGGLDNTFGELVEHLVAPGVAELFNKLGFKFHKLNSRGQKIFDDNGKEITEIDLLLENTNCVMAVEVKSKPREKHIEHHIRRLSILREEMDRRNDKRKIYGAVAGAVFKSDVKELSIKSGFYVLEQSGDTMKMNMPDDFVPGEW